MSISDMGAKARHPDAARYHLRSLFLISHLVCSYLSVLSLSRSSWTPPCSSSCRSSLSGYCFSPLCSSSLSPVTASLFSLQSHDLVATASPLPDIDDQENESDHKCERRSEEHTSELQSRAQLVC